MPGHDARRLGVAGALAHPILPPFLSRLRIEGLRLDGGSIDLALTRRAQDVGINVLDRHGEVGVTIVK